MLIFLTDLFLLICVIILFALHFQIKNKLLKFIRVFFNRNQKEVPEIMTAWDTADGTKITNFMCGDDVPYKIIMDEATKLDIRAEYEKESTDEKGSTNAAVSVLQDKE